MQVVVYHMQVMVYQMLVEFETWDDGGTRQRMIGCQSGVG